MDGNMPIPVAVLDHEITPSIAAYLGDLNGRPKGIQQLIEEERPRADETELLEFLTSHVQRVIGVVRINEQLALYQTYVTGLLGRGSYGLVYSGYCNGKRLALKVVVNGHSSTQSEVMALLRLENDEFVPVLCGLLKDSFNTVIVMSYAGRSFRRYVQDQIRQRFPMKLKNAQRMVHGLLQALRWLHSNGCIHNDIKPENIAVDEHYQVKVIDFGTAQLEGYTYRLAGRTLAYMSPELYSLHYLPSVNQRVVTPQTDIWSAGLTALFLIVYQDPHMIYQEMDPINWPSLGANENALLVMRWISDKACGVLSHKVDQLFRSNRVTHQYAALLSDMLSPLDQRPTADALLVKHRCLFELSIPPTPVQVELPNDLQVDSPVSWGVEQTSEVDETSKIPIDSHKILTVNHSKSGGVSCVSVSRGQPPMDNMANKQVQRTNGAKSTATPYTPEYTVPATSKSATVHEPQNSPTGNKESSQYARSADTQVLLENTVARGASHLEKSKQDIGVGTSPQQLNKSERQETRDSGFSDSPV